MAATPDTINLDGSSQSLIVIQALDASGRAIGSLSLRLDVTKDGAVEDYGTLSTKSVLTAADGRASVVYTAPPLPANSSAIAVQTVNVRATPVGTNNANAAPRMVEVRLVPPGVVPPPGVGPDAKFKVDGLLPPALPALIPARSTGVAISFDASVSSALSGVASYQWDFGDGSTGSGVAIQHTYSAGGTYAVRLTVTDNKGQTAWTTQSIPVASGPTANFTFTPPTPTAGLTVVAFDGTSSWAVAPATISSWVWDFGDGTSSSGATVLHIFSSARDYSVTLTVTDGNGGVGRRTQVVSVR
jgi:PKD repeat protein